MHTEIESIRIELGELSSEVGRRAAQRFHKEPVQAYGIKVPITRTIAKEWFAALKPQGKDYIFQLCDDLFESGFTEEALIASEWTYALRRQYKEEDWDRFEYWIAHGINNWATCDHFCNNTVGSFLLQYPRFVTRLRDWAARDHRWLQRAAAVSLVVPARKGLFLNEAFAIVDIELNSSDDLVQKGYGWMLKVYSRGHSEAVYQFVNTRRSMMPRTALRYAIEHFSPVQKEALMKKQQV